jgi:hypothetical protein
MASKTVAYANNANSILSSVFNPWQYLASIPTDGPSCCGVLKTVNTSILLTAVVGDFMIVMDPASPKPNTAYRLYYKTGSTAIVPGRPYSVYPLALNPIKPDQDLSEWAWGHILTAGMCCRSATLTGNAFTVSGQINAVSVSTPVNPANVFFEQFSSYKDNSCCFASATISEGICVLRPLVETQEMVYLAQDYPLTTNQVVVNDMPLTSIVTANTNLAPGASYTFLNWDFPNHPTPTYGNFKFDFYLPYNVTPAAVGTYKWEVTVYINGVAASTTAAIQTIDQKSYTIPEHSTSVAGPVVESFVFSLSVPVQYYYSDLFQINAVFFASALNPGAVDVVFSGATAANVTPYLRWEDYTHGRWSISSPKQFIAFSGVNPGQTVAVDTVSNLALIPGPDLAKNVTSTLAPPNFNDFRNALAFVSLIGTPGTGKFRWVWRLDEYKDFINNYANVYSDRTNVSKILAFSLKDFIKDALPVAGAALGGIFLGPEGVGLGSRAGSMISNILSADEDCVKKRKVVHAAVETSIMDLSTIVANDV